MKYSRSFSFSCAFSKKRNKNQDVFTFIYQRYICFYDLCTFIELLSAGPYNLLRGRRNVVLIKSVESAEFIQLAMSLPAKLEPTGKINLRAHRITDRTRKQKKNMFLHLFFPLLVDYWLPPLSHVLLFSFLQLGF